MNGLPLVMISIESPLSPRVSILRIWSDKHLITVVEAVATGLPVIVFRNILAYKVLSDASASLDFERGDYVSLSEAMSRLANESRLRDSMRANALNLARDKTSSEKVAKDSISIYSWHMSLSRSRLNDVHWQMMDAFPSNLSLGHSLPANRSGHALSGSVLSAPTSPVC